MDVPAAGRATGMRTRQRIVLLGLALVAAAALRFGRLHWGLDEGLWFHDESIWALRLDPRTPAAVLASPRVGLTYPTAYEYAVRAVHAVVGSGAAPVGATFAPDDPQVARIIGSARVASALASLLGVVAVAVAGWRLFGPDVGVVAALLLATSPFEALQVHSASVDPLLAAVGTLALIASVTLARRATAGAALVAGATAGLGFATKYTGAAFVAPALWAAIEAARARRRPLLGGALAGLVAVGALAAAGAACPRCALDPAGMSDVIAWHGTLARTAPFDGNRLAESLGWYGRPWAYQLVAALPFLLGLPAYLLGLAGVAYAAVRRTPGDRVVLALVVPYVAIVGAAQATFPRQLLPVVPALLLLAARAAVRVPRPRLRAALVAGVVAYSLVLTATQVRRLGWHQQREVAAFVASRSAGARVAFPSYGPYLHLDAALERAGLVPDGRLPGRWLANPAPFFVVPHWYAVAIRRDRRDPTMLAELDAVESGAAGYRPALSLPAPWYLQRALDGWLDPALPADLWQGATGFTVYAAAPRPGGA
jgi:hypothetical protein